MFVLQYGYHFYQVPSGLCFEVYKLTGPHILPLEHRVRYASISIFPFSGWQSHMLHPPPPNTCLQLNFTRSATFGVSHSWESNPGSNSARIWTWTSRFVTSHTKSLTSKPEEQILQHVHFPFLYWSVYMCYMVSGFCDSEIYLHCYYYVILKYVFSKPFKLKLGTEIFF